MDRIAKVNLLLVHADARHLWRRLCESQSAVDADGGRATDQANSSSVVADLLAALAAHGLLKKGRSWNTYQWQSMQNLLAVNLG